MRISVLALFATLSGALAAPATQPGDDDGPPQMPTKGNLRPDEKILSGTVGGSEAGTLIVLKGRTEWVVGTDANTRIWVDGQPGALSDMNRSMNVTVRQVEGLTVEIVAQRTKAAFADANHTRSGFFERIEGEAMFLSNGKKGKGLREQRVEFSDKTQVTINGQPAKIEDLKPGMSIRAKRVENVLTTIEALSKNPDTQPDDPREKPATRP